MGMKRRSEVYTNTVIFVLFFFNIHTIEVSSGINDAPSTALALDDGVFLTRPMRKAVSGHRSVSRLADSIQQGEADLLLWEERETGLMVESATVGGCAWWSWEGGLETRFCALHVASEHGKARRSANWSDGKALGWVFVCLIDHIYQMTGKAFFFFLKAFWCQKSIRNVLWTCCWQVGHGLARMSLPSPGIHAGFCLIQ